MVALVAPPRVAQPDSPKLRAPTAFLTRAWIPQNKMHLHMDTPLWLANLIMAQEVTLTSGIRI